ncbi:hypothetical protein Fot_35063 [Forsythia ovata]|uniref:Uncharacterized protein n=1 Tax=Forsythia ovata TaxID=205694 RepID=A0ABD1SKG9_9LAMI
MLSPTPPLLFLHLPVGRWTKLQPPSPPPIVHENFYFRPINNCQDQNLMFRDELFADNIRNGYRDTNNDMTEIWYRGFPQDGKKINDLDFVREDIERFHNQFGSRSERDFNTDPLRGNESYNERDEDER